MLAHFNTSSLDLTSLRDALFTHCQNKRFSFDNVPIERENLMNSYKMPSCYDDIVLGWFGGFRVWRFFWVVFVGFGLLGFFFLGFGFWGFFFC